MPRRALRILLLTLAAAAPLIQAGPLEVAAAGSVRAIAPYPNGYVAHQAVALADGKLFAYGSSGDELLAAGTPAQVLERRMRKVNDGMHVEPIVWNPAKRKWERQASPPECGHARRLASLTALPNNKVLVAGGLCDSPRMGDDERPFAPYTALSLWNGASGQWERAPSLASVRVLHSATVLDDGSVLLAGGTSDRDLGGPGGALASVERYSDGAVTALPPMITARARHSATARPGGGLLVAGGIGADGKPTNAVEIWDGRARQWRALAPMEVARADHSAVLLADGSLMVSGGVGVDGHPLTSVEVLLTDGRRWERTEPLIWPVQGHSTHRLPDGTVLLAGGNTVKGAPLARTMLWRPSRGWMAAGSLPAEPLYLTQNRISMTPGPAGGVLMLAPARTLHWAPSTRVTDVAPPHGERMLHAATMLDDGRVMLSGGMNGSADGGAAGAMLDAVEFYDPATASFTQGMRMHQPRVMHSTLRLDNGMLLVAGGWSWDRARHGEPVANTPELWDPRSGAWYQLEDIRFAPNDWVHMARLQDGSVMFFASTEAEQGALPYRAWIWDYRGNRTRTLQVPLRARHEAAIGILADGRVLRLGGRAHPDGAPGEGDAELWDVRSGAVQALAPVPGWRAAKGKTLRRKNGNLVFVDHAPARVFSNMDPQPAPIVEWDVVAGRWIDLPQLRSSDNWPLRELANGHLRAPAHVLAPGMQAWREAPAVARGADLLQQPDGQLLAVSTRPPYGGVLDTLSERWQLRAPRHEAPLWRSKPAMAALPDGRVLVAARMGDDTGTPTAWVWQPKDGSWSAAGRLAQPLGRHAQALALPSGKVLHLSVDNNNALVCELWAGVADAWEACGGAPVVAAFRHTPGLGLLADGRALLVAAPDTAWAYDEAARTWTRMQTEWNTESMTYGAPIRAAQPLLRVRDRTETPWLAADDAAARLYESAQDSVRLLWHPQEQRWAYIYNSGAMGAHARLLPDGCAYAWNKSTLFDAASGKVRTLQAPPMGIDPGRGSMLVLADGTAVFAGVSDGAERENAGFYRRKISCAGFAPDPDERAILPGMDAPDAGADAQVPQAQAGEPAWRAWLARHGVSLLAGAVLLAGAGLLARRALLPRWNRPAAAVLVLCALGALAAPVIPGAAPANPGVSSAGQKLAGWVGIGRHPCSMIGVWSLRQGTGRMYRVSLLPDGTYVQDATEHGDGRASKGRWIVRADTMIWTHFGQDEPDRNPIVAQSATSFKLVEMNGNETDVDLIRPIAAENCAR